MRSQKILGVIFSNMHDDTVRGLTTHRSMGSIPVGGRYRLIDFALSNMVNAGIEDVGVITKSNYQSLMDHLGSGREWDLARKRGGLCILPPFSHADSGMYRGKVEALTGISTYINFHDPDYIIMADCDLVANIDLNGFIDSHIKRGVDISVLYAKTHLLKEHASSASVFQVDSDGMVTDMRIKPHTTGEMNVYLNICIASRNYLERAIYESHSHNRFNFDEAILQAGLSKTKIYAHRYEGFCAKIGCMKSYYDANLSILDPMVRKQLFPLERPVYTKVRDDAPALHGLKAKVKNSLIADGCQIEGEVENSVLFRGVRVGRGAKIKNSIIMQNTIVGEFASMDYVITDKDVVIKDGRSLVGFTTYPIYIAKGTSV